MIQKIAYYDLNGNINRGELFQTVEGGQIVRNNQRLFLVQNEKQINEGISVGVIINQIVNN